MNTDAEIYGGSGIDNATIAAQEQGCHGKPHSLRLTVPPLATLILAANQ
jgi:1,4-alpha-glucan branching enzyme